MDIKKNEAEKPKPLVFRDNPEIQQKIQEHKAANPENAAYYARLVKEHPDRAIDTLVLRDVQKHENEMRLIVKQLPQAEAFYQSQTPEARARIDAAIKDVNPYYKDKAFVNECLRESGRQTRRQFTSPTSAPSATTATTAQPPPLKVAEGAPKSRSRVAV